MQPATLESNIAAFEAQRGKLECEHLGKWVVFYNEELIGIYADLEDAAQAALDRFGRGPYLIRQITNTPTRLPISLMIGGGQNAAH